MKAVPPRAEQWQDGRRTLLYAVADVIITGGLAVARLAPLLTPLPYVLALGHFVWGITHPAVGVRPAKIGLEQSAATLIFYVILGLVYWY